MCLLCSERARSCVTHRKRQESDRAPIGLCERFASRCLLQWFLLGCLAVAVLGFKAGQIPLIMVQWQKRTKYRALLHGYEASARETEQRQHANLASDRSAALGRKRSSLITHREKYNKSGLIRIPSLSIKQLSAFTRAKRQSLLPAPEGPLRFGDPVASALRHSGEVVPDNAALDPTPEPPAEVPTRPRSSTATRPTSLRLLGNVLQRPLMFLGVDWGKGSIEEVEERDSDDDALPVPVLVSTPRKVEASLSVQTPRVSAHKTSSLLRRTSTELAMDTSDTDAHPSVNFAQSAAERRAPVLTRVDGTSVRPPSAVKPPHFSKQNTPPMTRARAISIYSSAPPHLPQTFGVARWRDRGTQVDGIDGFTPKRMLDSTAQTDAIGGPDSQDSTDDDEAEDARGQVSSRPHFSLNLLVRLPSNQSLLDSSDYRLAGSTMRTAVRYLKGVNEWILRQGGLDASAELILPQLAELDEQCRASVALLGPLLPTAASPGASSTTTLRLGSPNKPPRIRTPSVDHPIHTSYSPPKTGPLSAEHVATVPNEVPLKSRIGPGLNDHKTSILPARADTQKEHNAHPLGMRPSDINDRLAERANDDACHVQELQMLHQSPTVATAGSGDAALSGSLLSASPEPSTSPADAAVDSDRPVYRPAQRKRSGGPRLLDASAKSPRNQGAGRDASAHEEQVRRPMGLGERRISS